MFARLLSAPLLPRLLAFAPVTPMLAAMHGMEGIPEVRQVILTARETPVHDRLRHDAFDDFIDLREAGRLGEPLGVERGRLSFLEDWNLFLEGCDDPSLMNSVTGPVMAMMESELIRVATIRKQARGQILERHLDAPIDLAALRARDRRVEDDLRQALSTGTSRDWHLGHRSERQAARGEAQIRLRDFQPVVEIRRKGALRWHPAPVLPLAEIAAARDAEREISREALEPAL